MRNVDALRRLPDLDVDRDARRQRLRLGVGQSEAAIVDPGIRRATVVSLALVSARLAETAPKGGSSLEAPHPQHDRMGQRLKNGERDRKQRDRQRERTQA